MRFSRLLSLITLLGLYTAPAIARAYHHGHRGHYVHHALGTKTYGDTYYTAGSWHRVHRPVTSDVRPTGATARCRDDSWSFSENHRGTCSHHGGVSRWL